MTATSLLHELARRKVRLDVVRIGGELRLRVDTPRGVVDEDLRSAIVRHKLALADRLEPVARVAIIDFETRSLARLDVVGGRAYAAHPTSQAICLVARLPEGNDVAWRTGEPPPATLLAEVSAGTVLVAHNADTFDRRIWDALGWPPARWIDSMAVAALAGLPRGLDDLAEHVVGRRKDVTGKRSTLALGRPGPDGSLRALTADDIARAVEYCRVDVALLADVWHAVLAPLVEVERDVRRLDREINDRGFLFDRELAAAVSDCEARAAAEIPSDVATVVRSPEKLKVALQGLGVPVPDIKKETLEALVTAETTPAAARSLVRCRFAIAGLTGHKLRAALARISDDGRVRDSLVYHGSHTGRWSGRGFQPQNLPRGVRDLDLDAAVEAVLARDMARLHDLATNAGASTQDVLASLVRACIVAPRGGSLLVADYAAIEPRALAWFVGDTEKLRVLREGGDLYRSMAARLFGVEPSEVTKAQRNAGKPPVLGCGYQMGEERFRTYAEGLGLDWSTMPISPREVVEMWRDDNPLVAGLREEVGPRRGGLWRDLEAAAARACLGETVEVACTTWFRRGRDVVCRLPSGRDLVYHRAQLRETTTSWGALRTAMSYWHSGKKLEVPTYGGLLAENVIQAIARDVLVDALLRLDAAGLRVVLHVHDEIVVEEENTERFDEMKALMRSAPTWAAGLPLDVEGYVSARYRGK